MKLQLQKKLKYCLDALKYFALGGFVGEVGVPVCGCKPVQRNFLLYLSGIICSGLW